MSDGDVVIGQVIGQVSDGDVVSGQVSDDDVVIGQVSDDDVVIGQVSDGDVVIGQVSDGDVVIGQVSDDDVEIGQVSDDDVVTSGGRLLHTRRPATLKAQSATVTQRDGETSSTVIQAEHSHRRELMSATECKQCRSWSSGVM